MHLETRIVGGKKKYYLAHSYRILGKVKNARIFLGTDLTRASLSKKISDAQFLLETKLTQLKSFRDPYSTVLSSSEIAELKTLESKGKIQLMHLSESDWTKFIETFTYNTNAIEGSTVTLADVKKIFNGEKWPERSKEEISETSGMKEAATYLRNTKEELSITLIKRFHELVFRNSKDFAGKFRARGVEVAVMNSRGEIIHQGAKATQIIPLLKRLVRWYKENKQKYPTLVLAAVVHNQFEMIHPFQDGNGRVGRLLLNNILLKHKLPPVDIELKNRKIYYDALKIYETSGNIRLMIELIMKEYRNLKNNLKS